MMSDTVTRVVLHDGSAWVVRSEASERASFRGPTRADAVARAKQIVRNLGGGTVRIHGLDGAVEQVANVVGPARGHRRARSRSI
jgi:hypothetical protein